MTELRLSRRFAATREHVFAAWTSAEVLRRWWALAGWELTAAEVDLREHGRYRLAMRHPEHGEQGVVGEYVEVRRPERLVYTWTWEGEPELMRGSERTLVTVEFAQDGDETEVVVTHSGFADERIRDLHLEGWTEQLTNLAQELSA